MAQHPLLALPCHPKKDVWNYYELLFINPIVIDDHLVIILQVPLFNKSLIMNVYKACSLPILHFVMQNTFHYSLEGEYMALSSDGYSATLPS